MYSQTRRHVSGTGSTMMLYQTFYEVGQDQSFFTVLRDNHEARSTKMKNYVKKKWKGYLLYRERMEPSMLWILVGIHRNRSHLVHAKTGSGGTFLANTFFAIFRLRAEWGWDALPQSYRESAYLSTDHNATDSYFAQFSTVLPSAEYSPKSSTGPSDSAQATNSSGSTQLNARESPESTSLRQEIPNKVRYYSDSDVLNEYCLYTCTRGYPFQSWPCQQEQRFTS